MYFQCKQRSERVVALMVNEETKKNNEKTQSTMVTVKQRHCDGRKKTHCDRMTRITIRSKNIKMNGNASMI